MKARTVRRLVRQCRENARREIWGAVQTGMTYSGGAADQAGVETACCQAWTALERSRCPSNQIRYRILRKWVFGRGALRPNRRKREQD